MVMYLTIEFFYPEGSYHFIDIVYLYELTHIQILFLVQRAWRFHSLTFQIYLSTFDLCRIKTYK